MDRDEEVAARIVRDREALFERHEAIVVARHHDAQPRSRSWRSDALADVEHELLLDEPARTARPVVLAAVPGIDHDRVEALRRNLGSSARTANDGRPDDDPRHQCSDEIDSFHSEPPVGEVTTKFAV